MGKWCPRCGAEYIEGWGECSNCGVPLVDEPPKQQREWSADAISAAEPQDPDEPDPFVPIWEGPTPEAAQLARRIEAAHIPVDLGEALEAGHSRVEVPRSYLTEARDALAGRAPVWPSAIGRDSTLDWHPSVRLALVIVAVGLIVLILLV
ncbi:MAG TPA: zinc ribbon domain-containing protein [Actinomycetota bacterium]|nr:zinc ribbon domain-containing protein [Actinomycetota bacterium]